ncbi:hypothetical protein B0H14DRAFT_2630621 [Mycena olivaceomarginata]|nr:hypothetical protein B0H14DRAFT_2630621 [Mycena olivaceomarginata]
MYTLSEWINTDAPRGRRFSLAVMTTPSMNPVRKTKAEWAKQDFHIWVLMTVHAPEGTNRKTLITYDTDVKPHHNESCERTSLGIKRKYVEYIRKHKAGREREQVWHNVPVPGGRPYEGHCFSYTLQWLLELVEKGFAIASRGSHLGAFGRLSRDQPTMAMFGFSLWRLLYRLIGNAARDSIECIMMAGPIQVACYTIMFIHITYPVQGHRLGCLVFLLAGNLGGRAGHWVKGVSEFHLVHRDGSSNSGRMLYNVVSTIPSLFKATHESV